MIDGYPIVLNLAQRPVLVVGGGRIAARKINQLVQAHASVTVVSPTLAETIDVTQVTWWNRPYQPADLTGFQLIFAATNDGALNQAIVDAAASDQWVNNVSDHDTSDFFNVAQIKTPEYLVTVSTLGHSPRAAKQLKQRLAKWLRTEG
ncbi:precorrin-2 dehydrogenase/sirohydrochlorin ferrochelatase family protein [Furfurilactobacillus entadae]|uniref:precorrin-2 dehydrogenase/sirohydrochlorin ferrochelatase family protein n=1 Tax=Furfurilactobacillus entadae TaxID=2922307 RepID=UPI0035E4A5DF